MRLPDLTQTIARVCQSNEKTTGVEAGDDSVQPQACCAEACVRVLGVKKCHCVLDAPICP